MKNGTKIIHLWHSYNYTVKPYLYLTPINFWCIVELKRFSNIFKRIEKRTIMKKISFSFTKSTSSPVKPKTEVKKDIQFIECIESNSIKIKGGLPPEEEEEEALIIPIKLGKLDRKADTKINSDSELATSTEIPEISVSLNTPTFISETTETLESIAVREILKDSQMIKEKIASPNIMVLPVAEEGKVAAAEESNLTDYEAIPVSDFGMAMLRGMGWKPEKGIGKNERVVNPTLPVLRPRGMGLGAEKRKIAVVSADESEDLTLKKGAFVRVLAGSNKNTYGEIQSFDEDAGRVIIKTAIKGSNISVNESMISVVSKSQYERFSRVLNQSEYEKYINREETDEYSQKESLSDSSESKKHIKDEYEIANGVH